MTDTEAASAYHPDTSHRYRPERTLMPTVGPIEYVIFLMIFAMCAIAGLLEDPERRLEMGRLAHEYSRPMTWWEIGARHRELLVRIASAPVPRRDTRRAPGRLA